MNSIITGDWHLGINTHGVHDADTGVNSRLLDIEVVGNEIIDAAINKKVDLFIHLGDLFHNNRPTPAEYSVAIRLFNRLEEACINSIFILGNHDYVHGNKSDPIESLDEYGWKYIKCISSPEVVEYDDAIFYVLPHCSNKDILGFVADNNNQSFGKFSAVLCHTTFDGCVVGSEDTMISNGVHMIPRDLNVDVVFSGHIHKSQVLSHSYGAAVDVYYPGSPMAFDFGERNDTKEYIKVKTDGSSFETEFVPINNGRSLIQIETMDQSKWPDINGSIVKVVLQDDVDLEEVESILYGKGVHKVASIKLIDSSKLSVVSHGVQNIKSDNDLMWSFLSERLVEHDARQAWEYVWEAINAS